MATATFPLSVEIGATISSTVGAALRSTEAQLGRLGAVMQRLENASLGASRLEDLRRQAAEAARAWRAHEAEIERLKAAKASGAWQTKGQASARARVAELETRLADPGLSEARRARLAETLNAARERLAVQDAKAEERYAATLERLIEKAGRAKAAFDQLKAAVQAEQAELERAGVATRQLASEKVKLGQALEQLKVRQEALARVQGLQQANLEARAGFRAQIMDAVALGGALYGLVQPAVQFESVMADVKKVVDFESPQQFAQMSRDVLELSTRIPMAAEGIGAIVAAAGQAGIAREELVRFAEDAAKMGVAFDLSGQQAGAAMTGLRSIFGLTQDEVVRLGDAINHLSNNMDAKASDMLNIANRAGSTAKLFGLTGAQLNALGATFLALKTPPEVAATGINALLMKLATADKQNDKFQQGLQAIGLSAETLKQMIARDAQGALMTFLRQVGQAQDVMGTLSDLFGMEYADDIAKLVGSLQTYEQAVGLVADEMAYAGSMQKEYEARSATTANNLQLLKNQMSRLAITVGNALLPALNALVGGLMKPIEGLARLAERFPVLTQVVVGATAGLIGLKLAALGAGYAWTFLKGGALTAWAAIERVRAGLALLQVQTAAAAASGGLLPAAWQRLQAGALGLIAPIRAAAAAFWGMLPAIGATTAALLANPITWIVAGIGAAVAGLALLIRKYWEPISAWIGGFWQGLKAGAAPAIEALGQALAPLAPAGEAIAAVFDRVSGAFSAAFGWLSDLLAPVTLTKDEFDSLSASGQSLGTVVGSALGAAFTALTAPIRAVGALAGWVMEGFQQLASFSPLGALQAAWQPASAFFSALWTGVVSGAQSAWQQLAAAVGSLAPLQALQSVIGSMLTALRELPGQFMSLGSAMLQGLAQGVRQAAEQAVAAVGEVAAGVRDRFKAMLGIQSPSRVFAALGGALALGLAQGVAADGPAAVQAVAQLAQSMQAAPFALETPKMPSPALETPKMPSPVFEMPSPTLETPKMPSLALEMPKMPSLALEMPSSAPEMSKASSPGLKMPSLDLASLKLPLPAQWQHAAQSMLSCLEGLKPTPGLKMPSLDLASLKLPAQWQQTLQSILDDLKGAQPTAGLKMPSPELPSLDLALPTAGLKMPSPELPSLDLALPTPGDLPPLIMRPALEGLPALQRRSAKDEPKDEPKEAMMQARAQPVPVNGFACAGAPMPVGAPAAPSAAPIHFAPQITIHAAAGADAREIASLVEAQLRRLLAEQNRNTRALYD